MQYFTLDLELHLLFCKVRRTNTNQNLFSSSSPGAVTPLWWQYQHPSKASSSTLHHRYSMKTFPASCCLDPAVNKTPAEFMHHTASPVYNIFIDILLLHTHTHCSTFMHAQTWPKWSHTHICTCTNLYHHRDLSSLPVIYWYYWYCNSSMCAFCFCKYDSRNEHVHFYAFEPRCNKALEGLIDDSIYFYQFYLLCMYL